MASAIQEEPDSSMISNPRFPHWCRIIRKTADSPLIDKEGFTPLNDSEEYDPLGSDNEDTEISEGQHPNESEETETEENPDKGYEVTVIYEGKCRSYEKNTTSDRGEVITSYRGLALPLTQDDWTRLGVIPREGDEIAVDRGAYKEYGRVIDRNPATASFAGTHILWRYVRN